MQGARGIFGWKRWEQFQLPDPCHAGHSPELDSGFENFVDSQAVFLVCCGLLVHSWLCSGVSGESGRDSMAGEDPQERTALRIGEQEAPASKGEHGQPSDFTTVWVTRLNIF